MNTNECKKRIGLQKWATTQQLVSKCAPYLFQSHLITSNHIPTCIDAQLLQHTFLYSTEIQFSCLLMQLFCTYLPFQLCMTRLLFQNLFSRNFYNQSCQVCSFTVLYDWLAMLFTLLKSQNHTLFNFFGQLILFASIICIKNTAQPDCIHFIMQLQFIFQ